MQRALQWDGIVATKMGANGSFVEKTPADIQAMKTFLETHHSQTTPYDIILSGETPANDPVAATAMLLSLEEAG
jgi:hypothetical protein